MVSSHKNPNHQRICCYLLRSRTIITIEPNQKGTVVLYTVHIVHNVIDIVKWDKENWIKSSDEQILNSMAYVCVSLKVGSGQIAMPERIRKRAMPIKCRLPYLFSWNSLRPTSWCLLSICDSGYFCLRIIYKVSVLYYWSLIRTYQINNVSINLFADPTHRFISCKIV